MLKLIGLFFCFISVISCILFYSEDSEISVRLCANPPSSCSCNSSYDDLYDDDEPLFIYSCLYGEFLNPIVFNMYFSELEIELKCINVSSFTTFPEFTNDINSTSINLKNCIVPMNETLFELTSKISRNIEHVGIDYKKSEDGRLNFNKNIFEGLSNLRSLEIKGTDSIVLNVDVFENFVNLKELTLLYIQIPDGIFDTLIQLEVLTIYLENEAELKVGIFKNQRNLVRLRLDCNSFLDPQIFANLMNLERLALQSDCFITWPENMFEHNQKLKSFQVYFLNTIQLPHKLLTANLQYVKFIMCDIEEISDDFFKNTSSIEKIDLSFNKLESMPSDIFVDQINLLYLHLEYNNIVELIDGIFDTTVKMRSLFLNSNKLESISRYLFAKLKMLEKLHLGYNKIKTIDNSFRRLVNLQEINLNHNLLSHNGTGKLFESLKDLKTIDLSNNELEEFSKTNAFIFFYLQEIDLRFNKILSFDIGGWMKYSGTQLKIDLSYNKIKEFKVKDFLPLAKYGIPLKNKPLLHLVINNNPIRCDCSAIDLVQFFNKQTAPQSIYNLLELNTNYLECKKPDHLIGRLVTDLSTTELKCNIEKDCPNGCQCQQRPADATVLFDCSFHGFLEIPTLPNFTNINMTNIELYVNNNSIKSIQLTNIPVGLKLLDLRRNSLQYLEDAVIERFESIDKLYLSDNPWTCNCQSVKFVQFYQIFRSKIDDADYMMCSDGRSFKTLEVKSLCIQQIEIFLVFFIVISSIGLSSTLYLLLKKQIKMCLYSHNCCLRLVSEEEMDKDMIYDAFFIFSHLDDNFVTDLIMDFEQPPKSFKCCVHHRDWMPGEMIVTQSLRSIRTSRRIIVVLSPMFLQSNWATWEFRVALIHAFKEKRSRVIIIIYGDPNVIDDLDEDLRTFVRFNTYLNSEDPWFDEKLLYAMPHRVYKNDLEVDNAEIENVVIE